MKTDKTYSYIKVCPKTGEQIQNTRDNGGICPYCGHDNEMSYFHSEKVVGRWIRPSFAELWFQGKKLQFLRKDEEDKIMEKLTQ